MSERMDTAVSRAVDALNEAFTDRYQSLARYVLQSGAYVADDDKPLLAQVRKIADFDSVEAERLAGIVDDLGGIPQVAPIPQAITELNYTSIKFLRKFLCEALCAQLHRYEAHLAEIDGVPAAKDALQRLCRELAVQLSELER